MMDSFCGTFVFIFIFQIFGNVFGQAGGGVAIGLGLGGDFMVDTALGELPNPFVAMAAQGGQNTNPSSLSNTGSQTDYPRNVGIPILLNQHYHHTPSHSHSGGFNTNSFSMFGSDHNSLFPLDASQIAGIANEPTVFLPGLITNNALTGSSGSTPKIQSSNHVDPNTKYILRNEDFTALGNVGHLVRVPAETKPQPSTLHNFGISSHNSNALGQSGIITINPNDIIGVADFNQPMTAGNTGLLNFHPGTGHISEISAMQAEASRLGSAVDMTSFLPPPFDTPPTAPKTPPTSILDLPSMNVGAHRDTSALSDSSSQSNANNLDLGLPPPISVPNTQQPTSISNIPTTSLQDTPIGLQSPMSNDLNNQNANYNVLDTSQNNALDVAISSVDAGSMAPTNPSSLPSNQVLVDSPNAASSTSNLGSNANIMNQQSFESSMFDTSAVVDPVSQTNTAANTAPATADITASNNFDMEMNFGLGSPSANALPSPASLPVGSAQSQIDTISNEANQLANMVRSGGSRFGAINPTMETFNLPSTNDQFSNPLATSVNDPGTVASAATVNSNIPAETANETHLNDLSSEGIYPFEGSHVAMDATLSEGRASIIDMNKALKGHEPLHIEPTTISGSAVENNGMLNISNKNVELDNNSINKEINISIENKAESTATTEGSTIIIKDPDHLLEVNNNEIFANISDNILKLDQVAEDVVNGSKVETVSHISILPNNSNTSKTVTMETGSDTDINTDSVFNNLNVSHNINNVTTNLNTNAAFTDMVSGSSVSGFGAGSITNLGGGVSSNINTGGMAISNFNTLMHDFSASADNTGVGNIPSPSALDSIQAIANVLNQSDLPTINEKPTIEVGGTALGSGTFDFGRISLPEKAFVTEKPAINKVEKPARQVRVDMSNFLPPPPYETGVGEFGASAHVAPDINQRTDQSNHVAFTSNTNTNTLSTNQGAAMEMGQAFMAKHGTQSVAPTTNSQPRTAGHSAGQTHTGPHAPPVVGSIFGTADDTVNANLIDKRFWEKAGLTREPDVDFMTSFLNNAKPSRTLNRGNENIQIVPYASDMSQIGTTSNNMIIVGRNDAKTVDQFGVADIYTREQQLNPSEWKQFLAKATQDATSPHVQSGTAFNYQTQNLIGSSETKPLTDSLSRPNFLSPTKPPPIPVQPVTRPANMKSSVSDFTMFAAPGMTGHKSVTIPNFAPRQGNARTSFAVQDRSASFGASGNTVQHQANLLPSSQASVQKPLTTSNQGPNTQQTDVLVQRAGGLALQGTAMSSGPQFGGQTIQTRTQQPVGRLGESGRNIQDEMNTFTLGQSILVADGTVPEFARPGGSAPNVQTSPGMQTLGQPAIRPSFSAGGTQQVQRPQPGGHSILMQGNNQGIVGANNNPVMPATFPSGGISSMTVNRTTDFSLDASLNPRPMVPGIRQFGQMAGNAMGATQLVGAAVGDTKQPMSPTLFTSGNRLAVFGPANDVSGRLINNDRQVKPVPAMRVGVLAPVVNCRYSADPTSEYYFIYKNGLTQHRFRCALGTAFDEMTCECSIRVSDHGDCLEVHMDFNEGVVVDSSLNRLPIGNENVEVTNSTSPIPGIALFGGDGKLTIWRYQNYDFRDHVMLKVQFRRGVGGQRYQPLISNCDGNVDGPSMAIVYDNLMQQVLLMLKTDNDTKKQLAFAVNPDEWNDVTYIYDGQEFIGIVNGVRRYVSKENPHLLGIIGGVIKSAPTQGLVEIRDAAIVLGYCPQYGYFRGAMVDIQIYTCIPKDFRLE